MRNFAILSILLAHLSMGVANAQTNDPCHCCTSNHQAFDFWIGDWTVYNPSEKIVGTNKVVKMQNGCVIQENWEASNKTNTGTSYNYFNKNDSTWNQIWVSSTGNILNLKGNPNENGEMVLKSKLVKSSKGNYYNQIIWSKNEDGSVTQRWDILNENSEPISIAFEGIYKKNR